MVCRFYDIVGRFKKVFIYIYTYIYTDQVDKPFIDILFGDKQKIKTYIELSFCLLTRQTDRQTEKIGIKSMRDRQRERERESKVYSN